MNDPTTNGPTEPTAQDVFVHAVEITRLAIQNLGEVYGQHAMSPRHWPHLAAKLQYLGGKLREHGEELAGLLVAYTEAHPAIEIPKDGPDVVLIPPGQHADFWIDGDDTIKGYAAAAAAEYGHPGITDSAVDLHAAGLVDSRGPVIVFQYPTGTVIADRPQAARVLLGGFDPQQHGDVIDRVLAHYHVTPGTPRFWPPVLAPNTFLSLDGAGLYDGFGRALDGPDEEELAARAGRGMT